MNSQAVQQTSEEEGTNKVYLLEMTEEGIKLNGENYDIYGGFVMVAPSEREARLLTICGDECRAEDKVGVSLHPCFWHDKTFAKCTFIGYTEMSVGMLLSSFHAG